MAEGGTTTPGHVGRTVFQCMCDVILFRPAVPWCFYGTGRYCSWRGEDVPGGLAGTGFLVWYVLRVADRELVKGDSDVEQSAEAEGEPLGEDVEDNGISPEESEE